MATRADQKTEQGTIETYTVAASQTVTAGRAVKYAAADHEIQTATAAGDLVVGIALQSGAAGDKVQVMLPGPVVQVVVGTGGATRGAWANVVSDGLTDRTLGGGSVVRYIPGFFTQSGVLGDYVGLCMCNFAGGSA